MTVAATLVVLLELGLRQVHVHANGAANATFIIVVLLLLVHSTDSSARLPPRTRHCRALHSAHADWMLIGC